MKFGSQIALVENLGMLVLPLSVGLRWNSAGLEQVVMVVKSAVVKQTMQDLNQSRVWKERGH